MADKKGINKVEFEYFLDRNLSSVHHGNVQVWRTVTFFSGISIKSTLTTMQL
jgi:hypothetical protein